MESTALASSVTAQLSGTAGTLPPCRADGDVRSAGAGTRLVGDFLVLGSDLPGDASVALGAFDFALLGQGGQ